MTFLHKLISQWGQGKFLCIGLDPDLEKIPPSLKEQSRTAAPTPGDTVQEFINGIVDATADIACAYKPNIAFYEKWGHTGLAVLRENIKHIRSVAPLVQVILDFKRADIGNSNVGYVTEAFEYFGVDAVTVSPYLGQEAVQPFLDQKDKGIFVLCRTSNPGAGEFQDVPVAIGMGGRITVPLYEVVAAKVAQNWNANGNCGLVVGATAPKELAKIRSIQAVDSLPILIPGIGAQGGSLEESVRAGKNSRGQGIIVNISREAIYASSGTDYAEAARDVALMRSEQIRNALETT
ncbi:MAG: orotidine-5'-phosphate decarboxylase [Patescibacteria group bacterium]